MVTILQPERAGRISRTIKRSGLLAVAFAHIFSLHARAQDAAPVTASLKAAELFELADRARDQGDYALAEEAYGALTRDPDVELRTEARFRLAQMLANSLERYGDAAVLLRRILDEKPNVAPVRLELARVLAELGDYDAARRELRAVRASGVPPEVEQRVRFFANALTATKRFGGGVDFAFAPSTNINRATRSETLGTVLGDFTIAEDAQAQSGLGIALTAQGYARVPLARDADLLLRANSAADLYRQSQFDDYSASLQAGPQWRFGGDRLALTFVSGWRWYGVKPYSLTYGITGNWQHSVGSRSQLRIEPSALREQNRQNELQDADRLGLAVGIDHAFSARSGGGFQAHGSRELARDPGYSTVSGGGGFYIYRELGRTTAVLNGSFRHLEADAKLSLFDRRRIDQNVNLSLSGTFRRFTAGSFAPVVRVRYERNWSTFEIYDFDRFGAEVGVAAAF